MQKKLTTTRSNLLTGCAILLVAFVATSARAADQGGQFLPLHAKSTVGAVISPKTGRQFLPLRNAAREGTPNKMIALNGGAGASGGSWHLSELRNTPRIAKAKEVPDDVKLAMANGCTPYAAQKAEILPKVGEKQEVIAAALAPVMEAHRQQQIEEENIDTDIEDAHEALAASLPDAVHEAVDKALAYVWPVADAHYRISSPYGYRKHPITGKQAFHAGIDIPAPAGTDVLAAVDGEVTGVGEHPRLGRYVKISHEDGTYSLYGHLQQWKTKMGRIVKAGDVIGKVGSTGRSTGPHLDFSIRRDGKPFNPMQIFAGILAEKKLALNK
jgi:hypothetical protein